MMKKRLVAIILVAMILTAVVVQPVAARATACEDFASNVVVGSAHSVFDFFACAAENINLALDLIGFL